jgi:hypothetical protein
MKIADDTINTIVMGAEPDFQRSGDEIMCPGCGSHFQSFSPSLAVTCPTCKLHGFQFPDNVPTCQGCGTRGLCAVVDSVHWKFWIPWPPEVTREFWNQAAPSGDHVGTELLQWFNRKPRTTRYINREALISLRDEIIDALFVQGSTRERAEDLTATLVLGSDHYNGIEQGLGVEIGNSAPTSMSSTETCIPYFDKNGGLIIPHNCPAKYRWWQGGQSLAETVAELQRSTATCTNG